MGTELGKNSGGCGGVGRYYMAWTHSVVQAGLTSHSQRLLEEGCVGCEFQRTLLKQTSWFVVYVFFKVVYI